VTESWGGEERRLKELRSHGFKTKKGDDERERKILDAIKVLHAKIGCVSREKVCKYSILNLSMMVVSLKWH
jgi:hypothetical protein